MTQEVRPKDGSADIRNNKAPKKSFKDSYILACSNKCDLTRNLLPRVLKFVVLIDNYGMRENRKFIACIYKVKAPTQGIAYY